MHYEAESISVRVRESHSLNSTGVKHSQRLHIDSNAFPFAFIVLGADFLRHIFTHTEMTFFSDLSTSVISKLVATVVHSWAYHSAYICSGHHLAWDGGEFHTHFPQA